jgi:hypothetical protein
MKTRVLFIVARNERKLFEELRRSFAEISGVEVVLDRRAAQRRTAKPGPPGRRRTERRASTFRDTHLTTMGWAVAHLR